MAADRAVSAVASGRVNACWWYADWAWLGAPPEGATPVAATPEAAPAGAPLLRPGVALQAVP